MKSETDYTVFIAEDEFPARELLVEFVLSCQGIKLIGVARSGDEAVEKLNKCKCDILLLDIDLPVCSGIEVLEKLDRRPRIIFTTAYENHAVKAFEIGADDYLVKPFSEERFKNAIDKSISMIRNSKHTSAGRGNLNPDVLMIMEKGVHYILPYEEIIYLSSSGRNSVIHTTSRDYITGVTLSAITGKLPAAGFVRIHKQYTVNVRFASHYSYYSGGQYIIYLKDEDKTNLPVGKVYADNFRNRIDLK